MSLIENSTNLYGKHQRSETRNLADVREKNPLQKVVATSGELVMSFEYLLGKMPEDELVLRSLSVGKEMVPVAVKTREDGKSNPRVMIAGITAAALIDLVGTVNFIYHSEGDFSKRVDCCHQVANAVNEGQVELGFVSNLPQPLHEGVGILMSTDIEGSVQKVHVIGKISSLIGR